MDSGKWRHGQHSKRPLWQGAELMFTPVPSEDQPHGIIDFVFISEAVFSQRRSPLGFPTYEKVDGVDTLWKTTALSFICLWYIFLILMCYLNISGLHQIFFVCFCDECTSRFVCFFQSLFFQQLRVNIIKRPLSLLHFLLIKYIQSKMDHWMVLIHYGNNLDGNVTFTVIQGHTFLAD